MFNFRLYSHNYSSSLIFAFTCIIIPLIHLYNYCSFCVGVGNSAVFTWQNLSLYFPTMSYCFHRQHDTTSIRLGQFTWDILHMINDWYANQFNLVWFKLSPNFSSWIVLLLITISMLHWLRLKKNVWFSPNFVASPE